MEKKIKGILKFDYDSEADVLYSFINKARKAINEDMDNGIIIRKDPRSHKLVGFTIIDFKKRLGRGIIRKIPGFENVDLKHIGV